MDADHRRRTSKGLEGATAPDVDEALTIPGGNDQSKSESNQT